MNYHTSVGNYLLRPMQLLTEIRLIMCGSGLSHMSAIRMEAMFILVLGPCAA